MDTLIFAINEIVNQVLSNLDVGGLSGLLAFGLMALGVILTPGFPGKAAFDTTQPGGEHAEDVSPLVKILSESETPLLSFLGLDPKPINNIRHEWLEDELIPDTTVLSAALGAGGTTFTVPDANMFQVGELIAVGSLPNNEVMRVTNVNGTTNVLTVTRGYGATVAVAHASGAEVLLMGELSLEGDDAPDAQKTAMERPYNISHIFNYAIEMTGTREAMIPSHLGDIGNEWAYETQKRTREALRDLEAAVLASEWNWVGAAPTLGSATVRRSMRGIVNLLRYGVIIGGVQTTPPANCYRNVAAANFTYDNFRDLQQQAVYNNGSREASLLLIPPALKVSVGKWKRSAQGLMQTNANLDDKRMTEIVDVIETDYGRVVVIMAKRLSVLGNVSLLLCPQLVRPKSFVSRSFHLLEMGRTGDRMKKELVGEYGLEMVGITQGWHSLCYNWTSL